MLDKTKPDIVYQPTVFARETITKNWPNLQRVITSGEELAAAFDKLKDHPVWRTDPRLRNIDTDTADEVLDLYNEVIADGRHIGEFLQNPAEVARKLGHKVSKKALGVVSAFGKKGKPKADDVGLVGVVIVGGSVVVVGLAITTAIVSSHADRRDRILVDESGRVKLGDRPYKKKKKKVKSKPHG